ncbi:MAG: hypothetical protein JXR84_02070, partial [Anaerolineae bacterium]|nr:hypothetical protein [Anaerolineae bacterium]
LQIDNGAIIPAPEGYYSATLYAGRYVLTARAPFHWTLAIEVDVDRDQRQDFALEPTPCLLVVDDDFDNEGNAYDDQAYYTRTLESLNVSYDVWSVPDNADGPPPDMLRQYRGIIWLTGKDWDYTLTTADQAALTAYLDGGGRLFVSGQDIGWDIFENGGEPSFYHNYLHANYLEDNINIHELQGVDFLSGITVTIEGGDGANNQEYPSAIDVVGNGVGIFHYIGGDNDWAATAFANETYRVVYFAFGFEGIHTAADRQRVMAYVLNYLQPCPLPPPYAVELQSDTLRIGLAGQTVAHTVELVNTGMLSDAYDLTLGPFVWTTTLGLPSGTALLPITRTPLLAPRERLPLGLHVTIPPTATIQDFDEVTLTATSVYSPVNYAVSIHRTVAGNAVYLPLVLRE